MRITWLMGVAAAAMGAFALASAASADTILLARMTSPSEQHHAAERTDDPTAAPQKPTTIGAETLRKLMATIAPKDAATSQHHAVENTHATNTKHTKKSAKKQRKHAHPHAAQRKAAKQPDVLGGIAPARLKPCHHAHPVPEFLRNGEHGTPAQPAAPWQTRQLRFGPRV